MATSGGRALRQPRAHHDRRHRGGHAQPLLRRALHSEDAEGHDAHPAVAHRRRRPGGGRDDLQLHPQRRDRLDAAGRRAHGEDGERAARGDRGLPRRQALPRAHLLGSGFGAGAGRPADARRIAGRRRRDRPQGRGRDAAVQPRSFPTGRTTARAGSRPAAHEHARQTALERVEDAALLMGRGRYIDDLPVAPGTGHAAILRSPHPHARLLGVDTAAAGRRMPGVYTRWSRARMRAPGPRPL